jgi:hypothetical protein
MPKVSAKSSATSKGRGRRMLQGIKSAKKSARKCDVASLRHSRTPVVEEYEKVLRRAEALLADHEFRAPSLDAEDALLARSQKEEGPALGRRRSCTPAKGKYVAKKTPPAAELSVAEQACFGEARKAMMNTSILIVLGQLFPPAASYRILATAIELTQRTGLETAFYAYIASCRPPLFTPKLEIDDLVAATLSLAAKLEGAFLWPHHGKCLNDVPWKLWMKLLLCNVYNAKQLEWAMMHAFYSSSSEADYSTNSALFGPEFDWEFWSKCSKPREIN